MSNNHLPGAVITERRDMRNEPPFLIR